MQELEAAQICMLAWQVPSSNPSWCRPRKGYDPAPSEQNVDVPAAHRHRHFGVAHCPADLRRHREACGNASHLPITRASVAKLGSLNRHRNIARRERRAALHHCELDVENSAMRNLWRQCNGLLCGRILRLQGRRRQGRPWRRRLPPAGRPCAWSMCARSNLLLSRVPLPETLPETSPFPMPGRGRARGALPPAGALPISAPFVLRPSIDPAILSSAGRDRRVCVEAFARFHHAPPIVFPPI